MTDRPNGLPIPHTHTKRETTKMNVQEEEGQEINKRDREEVVEFLCHSSEDY